MSTAALQSVWEGIMAYNLTPANKRWLAQRLWEEAGDHSSSKVESYTLAELRARIEASEASFAAGNFYTEEQAGKMMQDYVSKRIKEYGNPVV